eukprot:TRINITY_DN1524_c0_g1_i1.p1 TRINITY_DN1524_c0_g1~~TRINITY_DN1524_c0_g1_i1.p1  ORF type:complete len:252 (+),score=62.14 TRINITY_DN1524_c0_g1_i1:31-756(+)
MENKGSELTGAPGSLYRVNQKDLDVMVQEMGMGLNRSARALVFTGDRGVEVAVNWIMDHLDDEDIDDPPSLIDPSKLPSATHTSSSYRYAPSSSSPSSSTPSPSSSNWAIVPRDPNADTPLANFANHKLVMCVRKDLKMSVGKIAAQCCHATLGIYKRVHQANPHMLSLWENGGAKKVVVELEGAELIANLERQAFDKSLPSHVVRDAGRTEVDPGTATVFAIFGPENLVDDVTGHLRLLK